MSVKDFDITIGHIDSTLSVSVGDLELEKIELEILHSDYDSAELRFLNENNDLGSIFIQQESAHALKVTLLDADSSNVVVFGTEDVIADVRDVIQSVEITNGYESIHFEPQVTYDYTP